MNYKYLFSLAFSLLSLTVFGQKEQTDLTNYQKYFNEEKLEDIFISDEYTSQGITHIYFHQAIDGIPIINSRGAIHFGGALTKPYISNQLLRGIDNMKVRSNRSLSAGQALLKVAQQKGYDRSGRIDSEPDVKGTKLKAPTISTSDVIARSVYFLKGKDQLTPAYDMTIDQVSDGYFYNYIVDANSGEILATFSLTVECSWEDESHVHSTSCTPKPHTHKPSNKSNNLTALGLMTDNSYNIYPSPVESPIHGARSVEVEPWLDNVAASPAGWHDIDGTTFTVTKGNNADAYIDTDNSNGATNGDADRAEGGANLSFDFPLDLGLDPLQNQDAAVTNLFYWSNIIHDVMYNYGFDEASGNFQEFNYTPDGAGGDYVFAEAQDAALVPPPNTGNCNANFGTPADGGNPRMQMYLCTNTDPSRDGDYDNGVIIHEYGHGISNRLTGGPGTGGCLGNQEQMGEGWSDYIGMVMTMEAGDTGAEARGMGTYLFGQEADGPGIRPFPYSTDLAVNPMTYNTIGSGVSVPHGVGSVWATMLWEVTWALIDQYGFDADLYNGTGGNNIALALVTEGMKLQPCNPGFVDGRDAIIAADQALYGGANLCLIWEAFAKRGLGFSANQGSTGSVNDGSEAFDMPPACTLSLILTADVSEAIVGDQITYKLKATNFTSTPENNIIITDTLTENVVFDSATDGGTEAGGLVSFPAFNLAAGESDSVYVTVTLDGELCGNLPDINDDLESGISNWNLSATGSTSWTVVSDQTNSGTEAFFAQDAGSPGIANIDLASPIGILGNTKLSFFHNYDTEVTWDGGVVEISTNDGATWQDLGNDMITNGYNSTIYNSRPGFSGNSNGWIQTTINLAAYDGNEAIIRFQMNCDQSVAGNGWWIDDIVITNIGRYVSNRATLTSDNYTSRAVLDSPTKVIPDPTSFCANLAVTDIQCAGGMDGVAEALPLGGTGNYTYIWSNGATTQVVNNLSQGSYFVTISDGTSDIIKDFDILEPDSLDIDAHFLSISASGESDGSATVDVAPDAVLPITYLWSQGETTNSIEDLAAGEYSVIVTDGKGCEAYDTVQVATPDACEFALYELQFQFDQWPEDVSFTLQTESGDVISREGPYSAIPDGSLISRYFCLENECYDLIIDDAFGDGLCANNSDPVGFFRLVNLTENIEIDNQCDIGAGVTVNFCAETEFVTVEANVIDETCDGSDDGSIQAVVIGGTGPYTYSWSNGATSNFIKNLSAGLYTITATDNGIEYVETFEVLGSKYSKVDVIDDVSLTSLRGTLNNGCVGDTVLFDLSLLGETIILTNGEIEINTNKTIIGLGMDNIIVDATDLSRLFKIAPNTTVSVEGITLQNGSDAVDGGNILNEGVLNLKNVKLLGGSSQSLPRGMTNNGNISIFENVIIEE